MLLDAVDEHDSVVGTVVRDDVFRTRTNFRVAHVFLFNEKNELLLQQLPASHARHPGAWGSSVAGYVMAGEDYRNCAERKLAQELRISTDLHYFGKTSMVDEGCTKFIGLCIATYSGAPNYDHGHIAHLEYATIDKILTWERDGIRMLTPTFAHLLRYYLRQS